MYSISYLESNSCSFRSLEYRRSYFLCLSKIKPCVLFFFILFIKHLEFMCLLQSLYLLFLLLSLELGISTHNPQTFWDLKIVHLLCLPFSVFFQLFGTHSNILDWHNIFSFEFGKLNLITGFHFSINNCWIKFPIDLIENVTMISFRDLMRQSLNRVDVNELCRQSVFLCKAHPLNIRSLI